MIELIHVKKSFGNFTPLKDVTTKIEDGEVISIIGPSGTGKSTLLRCINMLDGPTEGQIIIDGVNITSKNCDLNQMRMKVGMVFQSFNLYENMNAIENVMYAQTKLLKVSRTNAYNNALKLLTQVGMKDHYMKYPNELSGGQKQRVAIARTLALKPKVILFDEPTSALDPLMVREVCEVIKDLKKTGITMIIVTHEMNFAKSISTRVFYMDQGGIYEDGTPEQIFDDPRRELTQAFIKMISTFKYQINYNHLDMSEVYEEIIRFSLKSHIAPKLITKLYSFIDELCALTMYPLLKEGESIDIRAVNNGNTEELTMDIIHNIDGFSLEKDVDELTMKIISKDATITESGKNKIHIILK